MYAWHRIPVYKSVDGMVGRMIRQHRQSKGGGAGAQVVEIDAQPQSQAIRKDRLRLPGPWRIRFGSSDGSLPAKYAGYYYKQPSDSFGGCNDSETMSTQAYQKKFFPRAVYVQIAGVAPQSYMYSINDKDLNVSHCTDNPNYQDPLKLTEHPGCAKVGRVRGAHVHATWCTPAKRMTGCIPHDSTVLTLRVFCTPLRYSGDPPRIELFAGCATCATGRLFGPLGPWACAAPAGSRCGIFSGGRR